MSNYWVVISANTKCPEATIRGVDVYNRMMREGRWGFREKTPNAKRIQKGDRVVFYIAGGSGENSHCFVGIARVTRGWHIPKRPRKILIEGINIGNGEYPLAIELDGVRVWVDPVEIHPLIPNLAFVKRSKNWGVYLQGGIKSISKQEFDLIAGGRLGRLALSMKEVGRIKPRLIPARKKSREPPFSAEMSGIILGNTLYVPHKFKNEKEFEAAVVSNATMLFGSDCFYFNIKKRIGSKKDSIAIPDGYLLDLSDISNPRIHLVENELSKHDLYGHIVTQILNFKASLNMRSKKKIRDILYDLTTEDSERVRRIRKIIKKRSLHKVLDEAAFSDFSLVVAIDETTSRLEDAKKELVKLVEEIRVIVFETYVEKGKKKANIVHCFWELP